MILTKFFTVCIGLVFMSTCSCVLTEAPAAMFQKKLLDAAGNESKADIPRKNHEKFVEVAAEELGNIFEIIQGLSLYTDKDIVPILAAHGLVPEAIEETVMEDRSTELHRRGSFASNFMFAMRAIVNCVAVITREAAVINPSLALLATFVGLMNEIIE